MKPLFAAVFGFGIAFLFGFTPTVPPRHATPFSLSTANLYMHDPYVTSTIGNITGKVPASGTFNCNQSQGIQIYDDGGSVGVNCLDAFNGTYTAVTTPPAAPAADKITEFAFQLDSGMPALPYNTTNYYGIPSPQGISSIFTYYSTVTKWAPQCWMILGWAKNINYLIGADTQQQVGNVSNPSWASTSLLTRSKTRRMTAASAAINVNYGAKPDSATQAAWRGNTAGAGGWLFWTRFSVATANAGLRYFVGMQNAVTFMTVTVDPNTITDAVGIECQAGDSNFSICSNDNTSTATCATLGASFPCTTAGAFYDLWLSASPNSSTIEYYVERLDSAATAAGSLSSDLPRNTVQLNWEVLGNTGTQTTALAIDWMGTCILANL